MQFQLSARDCWNTIWMDGWMDEWMNGWWMDGWMTEQPACKFDLYYKELQLMYSVPKESLDFGYHPAPEEFCTL